MPIILSDTKGKYMTSVSGGSLVWADVLFEGETKFGDKVRVLATGGSADAGGKGVGVAWNGKKETETAGEFTERIAAIFCMMADVRDKMPLETSNVVLTVFHELWGPWYTRFVQSWNTDSDDEMMEETVEEDGED